MSEYSEFAGQYIDILRGCNALMDVIDIDVAPERPQPAKKYETITEVRADLENLAASLPAGEPDREVLEQKMSADLMYLRVLDDEDVEFHEYGEGTVGIRPEPIDEERVQGGLATLDMLLKEHKLGYNAESKEEFDRKFVIESPQAIDRHFKSSTKRVRKNARDLVADPGDNLDVEYIEDPKEFWTAYLGKTASRYWVKVNLAKPFTKDWIDTAVAHEYGGHVLQLERWQQAIEAGDMNAALGITAAHTAYAVQAEGVAQTAEHLMLDDSWHSIFRALYNECAGRVFHNADYMINTGEDPQAAERYVRDRLPLMPPEMLSAQALTERTRHPLYRAYLMAYAPALEMLRPVRSMEADRQKQVLKTLYERALTPAQISRLVLDDQKIAA